MEYPSRRLGAGSRRQGRRRLFTQHARRGRASSIQDVSRNAGTPRHRDDLLGDRDYLRGSLRMLKDTAARPSTCCGWRGRAALRRRVVERIRGDAVEPAPREHNRCRSRPPLWRRPMAPSYAARSERTGRACPPRRRRPQDYARRVSPGYVRIAWSATSTRRRRQAVTPRSRAAAKAELVPCRCTLPSCRGRPRALDVPQP